jgi:hypothetical protein
MVAQNTKAGTRERLVDSNSRVHVDPPSTSTVETVPTDRQQSSEP